MDCHQLEKKITLRIKTAYSKHLSYAGWLQIINAVFFSIYNFWGSVFILTQSVLKEVDKRCRDYLLGSTEEHKRTALVAWDKECASKRYGGLNIKNYRTWNIVVVGKLLLQIAGKLDSLWIRWTHGIYMKNGEQIWAHQTPADCSWYRKKLTALRPLMNQWYQGTPSTCLHIMGDTLSPGVIMLCWEQK